MMDVPLIYINDVDLYEKYSVVLLEDGYNSLFSLPAMKEPEKNDWAEEDGIEVNLDHPAFGALPITLRMVSLNADVSKEFLNLLMPGEELEISIPFLERKWKCRFVSLKISDSYRDACIFNISFSVDHPQIPSGIDYSGEDAPVQSSLAFDDVPIHQFGLVLTEDIRDLDSIICKNPLMRSFKRISGIDAQMAHKRSSNSVQTTFNCCLIAQNIAQMWSARDAFFSRLMSPGERTMSFGPKKYKCHYLSVQDCRLLSLEPEAVLTFNLKMSINKKI